MKKLMAIILVLVMCISLVPMSAFAASSDNVISKVAGDANGDGNVNGADLVRIRKYIAGMDVEIDLACSDVNGDGKVNGGDLVRLRKYLAGMNVELVSPEDEITYTVIFDSNGGTEVEKQVVKAGDYAEEPGEPTKDGVYFTGWFLGDEDTPFDFESIPITNDITLVANWVDVIPGREDGIIDLGALQFLIDQEKIEVTEDENGNIRAIDGKFTESRVTNEEEAKALLDLCQPLFGDGFDPNVSDIEKSTVSDDEYGTESFYKYTPTINGIDVYGNDIIISTDENGNVTGLHSTYDSTIASIDMYATISEEEAIQIALENLSIDDEVKEHLNEYVSDDVGIKELFEDFKSKLSISASLIIYAVNDRDEFPSLNYQVQILPDVENTIADPDIDNPTQSAETIELEELEEEIAPIELSEDAKLSAEWFLGKTYYIYANGESAAGIHEIINNADDFAGVKISAVNTKGNRVIINAVSDNNEFKFISLPYNIAILRSTEYVYKTRKGTVSEFTFPGALFVTKNRRTERQAVSLMYNMERAATFYSLFNFDLKSKINKTFVQATYNYSKEYNACWTPTYQQFVFSQNGNLASGADVVGHEYTHAVINYVVGNGKDKSLRGGESGALNEALADVMGAIIENKNGSARWQMGEDSNDIARNISQAHTYDNYDKNQGVHYNSQIFSYAAYKMMTDSRTRTMTPRQWGSLFYRSFYRLGLNATFLDARAAVLATAKQLGATSSQIQAMVDGFNAARITPPLNIHIALSWGSKPVDLDAHLVGPQVDGNRFHMYYQNPYILGSAYTTNDSVKHSAVRLNYDYTNGYGPEITTIYRNIPGKYYFFVHDYTNRDNTNSKALAKSGATVRVYIGSKLWQTFKVDGRSKGTVWNVFELEYEEGNTVKIKKLDQYKNQQTLS